MVVLRMSSRAIDATRPSHASWNRGSSISMGTVPKPCIPPMSWTPSMRPSSRAPRPLAIEAASVSTQRGVPGPRGACHEGRSLRCGGPGRAGGRRYRVGRWCSSGSQRVSFVTVAFVKGERTDRRVPTLGEDVESSWSLGPLARARPPPRTTRTSPPRLQASSPSSGLMLFGTRGARAGKEHEMNIFDYEVLSTEHARRVGDPYAAQRRAARTSTAPREARRSRRRRPWR